jgi:hypothetical protein
MLGGSTWVWKEKRKYYSIRTLLPALALLALDRIREILLEHPMLRQSSPLGLSAFVVLFASLGNVADVIGMFLLILGFAAIMRHEQSSAQLIDQLATFFPICSYCKKYRTESAERLPSENI